MSNDEKTTVAAPVDSVQQVNNKEVEEKHLIEEQAKNTEANIDNGKSTQQVEATTDAAAKEATPNPAPPAPKPPKPAVHKVDFEKNVVYLYQFSRTKNIPSPSPFCLKVETWLRMAEIKYEVCWEKKVSLYYIYILCPLLWWMSAAHVMEPTPPLATDSYFGRRPLNACVHTRMIFMFDRPVIFLFQKFPHTCSGQ